MATLAKLDNLCVRIGLAAPLRTHKYYRVAVPSALTGQTLVQFLQELLPLDDAGDALHLATLLLHYGYLFPVIEHSSTVKEDNTLYRLQLPYFWPSHARQTDDVEYAIYLNKRLLRNDQKHGLEEDEVEAYNKLLELLGHIWGFIGVQAEMQLKIHKERKKGERVVFDSQERAFWRNRKPGQANCLEQHICKLEKKLRRATIANHRQVLQRLQNAIKTKPWLKAGKASETMVKWCERFQEYDPFVSTPQPSNPWITDDMTLWALNTDTVEIPSERRVKRWGFSVQELVKDPIGRQVLETFLESEFSSENIRFWMAIQDLKFAPNSQVEAKAEHIHSQFFASGAPCQVNVDSRTREATAMAIADNRIPRRHAYSTAEENVFTLMSRDSYPRFRESDIYLGVLSAARQQGKTRLGWRNFLGAGKKTAPPLLTNKPHKMSRDDNSHNSLPKQLSSDSLPVKASNTQRLSGDHAAGNIS